LKKTYAQILEDIESLKQQAETLRAEEIAGVIARMKEAIAFYGLTAEDLGFTARRGRPPASARADRRSVQPRRRSAGNGAHAKYQDGNGHSWAGRGPRPKWLKEALASGHRLEEFKH
jgi:DNA-binding protein H-NS